MASALADVNTHGRPCVDTLPGTSNLKWAKAPGNVRLSTQESGLPRDPVVNVSRIVTLDRSRLIDHVGRIGAPRLDSILAGIDLVLGALVSRIRVSAPLPMRRWSAPARPQS